MSASREYLRIGLRCIEETSITEDKADDKGRATEKLRCLAMQLNAKIVIIDKQNGDSSNMYLGDPINLVLS
jgi:hypothetical protein